MSFDDLMKKMRQDYVENLKSQISDLGKMKPAQDHLEELESFFHKLKGSGASYGLPKISKYGARYEEKAKNKDWSPDDLDGAMAELQKLLAQAD